MLPVAHNEPVLSYAPGAPERAALKARLAAMTDECPDVPLVIGGRELRTGDVVEATSPHRHRHVIARWHKARPEDVTAAIDAALDAQREWASWTLEQRAGVFLRAADLLAGPWRATLNAATMLGQSKTAHQAEIDAACELADFWRFNVHFAQELAAEQPRSVPGAWNRVEYRPLEGFVYAVTPFNFTAIAGNLPTAPALLGNVAVWKPASSAMLSAYWITRLLHEAGLPPGVVNVIPGDAATISGQVLTHRDLAGVHFTGSTGVFNDMWRTIGAQMDRYRSYPRIVGETGGKDFVIAHPSADPQAVAVGLVRGAFEYQGQKCSAASRAYLPRSLWPEIRDRMLAMVAELRMGDVADFRTFVGAVIDQKAFRRIEGYLADARANATVLAGGHAHGDEGWFIEPTIVQTDDPGYRLLCEEIFGPVLTVHVYDDARWTETLQLVDRTSPYALTGAVFARERSAIVEAHAALVNAAGNFYINDKPTGAVVGQQPFGGARASGTNDKAGSKLNLLRWVSARTVKETFVSPLDHAYPHMGAE